MEKRRKQKYLRTKLFFRIFIFVISFIGCWYAHIYKDNSFSNLILGISGSALVWSLIHIIDYSIDMANQYHNEKNRFLVLKNRDFRKIKNIIRPTLNSNQELSRKEISQAINEMIQDLNNYYFENSIYPLSFEFIDFYDYMNRLSYIFTEELSEDDLKLKDNQEYYNKLVVTDVLENPSEKLINNLRDINEEIIYEASNEYLYSNDLPTNFSLKGNLDNTIGSNQVITYKTFKPDLDFDYINTSNKNTLKIVLEVLFNDKKL